MKKRIVLIIHTNTYFPGLLPLALSLQKIGNFEPVFLFARHYPHLAEDIKICQRESISVLFENGVEQTLALQEKLNVGHNRKKELPLFIQKWKRRFGWIRSKSFLYLVEKALSTLSLFDVIIQYQKLSCLMGDFRKTIRNENISLVILPADNRYDLAAYIKAAHHEKIGVVVVPQFMASALEWAEYVWNQQQHHGRKLMNKVAGILYPRWKLDFKDRTLVALPGAQIIAREWLKIAPPLPWVLHSGATDYMALESNAVRDYCLAEGLPSEKLVVTGSIAHDMIFDQLSDRENKHTELCQKLGYQEDHPIILSALPPDVLYMDRPECDFQIYSELVEFWCKSISAVPGYNHIVALHPSVQCDEMKYLEKFDLKITREPTANIIPLCDIFVASISSTIQWAIACGIPVLNYDVFRYRYTDYQNVDGVITLEEKQDFLHALTKMTTNPDYYAGVRVNQSKDAENWGCLDGKVAERLDNLFTSLITYYDKENQQYG